MGEEDGLAREMFQLLRAFGVSIAHKVTHVCAYFLHHKNLGAVAALAIGFYCTWKLFKVPSSGRTIRESKPDALATENLATNESEVPQDGELTIAKAVKRQLLGARKVTCQLLDLVLEESTTEELDRRGSATIRESSVEVLLELARSVDLYLFANVCNDQSEEAVLSALEKAGLFRHGFNRDKVLFYETDAGSNSFVRQLEPDWHLDASVERVIGLSRFVRHELLVHPSGVTSLELPSNILVTPSIESYFGVQA